MARKYYDDITIIYDSTETDYNGIFVYVNVKDDITIDDSYAVASVGAIVVDSTITIAEDVTLSLDVLYAVATEATITIAEDRTIHLDVLQLLASNDVIVISERPMFPNVPPFLGPVDDIAVVEIYVEMSLMIDIRIHDVITVVDFAPFQGPDLNFDVFSPLTIDDWADEAPFWYWTGVLVDDIIVTEYAWAFDVFDTASFEVITIGEMAETFLPLLVPNIYDDVAIYEDLAPILETLFLLIEVPAINRQYIDVEIVKDLNWSE